MRWDGNLCLSWNKREELNVSSSWYLSHHGHLILLLVHLFNFLGMFLCLSMKGSFHLLKPFLIALLLITKQETRRFSVLSDGMKRGRWARWLATLRKVHQKNKLTTATAFFYKLQKDSSISNYFHSSNLIPLTTQNKKINYLVVKDTESFQTKLQSSEDF